MGAFTWTQEMRWINAGLVLFQAVYIVSVETILNVLFAVIGAIIFFEDYKCMTSSRLALFILGIVIANVGVLFLSMKVRDIFVKKEENSALVKDDEVGNIMTARNVALSRASLASLSEAGLPSYEMTN